MYRQIRLVLASCALVALGATTVAQAAQPQLALVSKPATRFEHSIEAHKLELRYRDLIAQARRLDAAPKRDLLGRADVSDSELRSRIEELAARVKQAQRQAGAESFGLAAGVSQSTLDAIAACESGGDPTVVDASGTYYGKYQFDLGTWSAVGGSGNPAEAPESEQDYRASILYSQAGSSPWPVCGV